MLNRPARWFHGWNVVGTAFLSQGFAIGLSTSTYGVYVLPMGADLNASRFQATLGYALLMAGLSVTAPIAGRLIDQDAKPFLYQHIGDYQVEQMRSTMGSVNRRGNLTPYRRRILALTQSR